MSKDCYYEDDDFKLLHGDALLLLKKMKPQSIDMIFADPPYFLSNGGQTCRSGKAVSVDKGEWDIYIVWRIRFYGMNSRIRYRQWIKD